MHICFWKFMPLFLFSRYWQCQQLNQFQERMMPIFLSTYTFVYVDSCIFMTHRILNQSLQTGKQQYQPRTTATRNLKHHQRRAYQWLQCHPQQRSVEYATVKQSQTSLWFLLVFVLALYSMYIRAVCKDGLRVQTLRNVNCVNTSSAWNPRWSLSQRLVMLPKGTSTS